MKYSPGPKKSKPAQLDNERPKCINHVRKSTVRKRTRRSTAETGFNPPNGPDLLQTKNVSGMPKSKKQLIKIAGATSAESLDEKLASSKNKHMRICNSGDTIFFVYATDVKAP